MSWSLETDVVAQAFEANSLYMNTTPHELDSPNHGKSDIDDENVKQKKVNVGNMKSLVRNLSKLKVFSKKEDKIVNQNIATNSTPNIKYTIELSSKFSLDSYFDYGDNQYYLKPNEKEQFELVYIDQRLFFNDIGIYSIGKDFHVKFKMLTLQVIEASQATTFYFSDGKSVFIFVLHEMKLVQESTIPMKEDLKELFNERKVLINNQLINKN